VGDDVYYVDARTDYVVELPGQGTDSVFATTSYTLYSNVENLTLLGDGNFTAGGNSLNNRLVGNTGNNLLAGGLGADTLEGGLGDDIYVVNDSQDTIIDSGGSDTLRSTLDVMLMAGLENIELIGIGNTSAVGNGADNRIVGNMGDNLLEGRAGKDTLTGGAGSDQFLIANNGAGFGVDYITDFTSGEDLLILDLPSWGVDPMAMGLLFSGIVSADSFVKRAGAAPLDPDDYYLFDTATGMLKFDVDGNGSGVAVNIVQLTGVASQTLAPGDIYLAV